MKAALAAALLGIGRAASAENIRPDTTVDEQEWMGGVHSALEHRDCELAVARLNQGLERRYSDAFLLAGAMFEQGLCVKTEWDRAATMYQRALAVGHRGGQFPLVAGLAECDAPVALWWAQERDAVTLPDECRVPAEAHRRAEAYAAAVQAWPAGRIAQCAYVAGVVAAVTGEVEYPGDALGMLIEGRIEMRLFPGLGRIEWHTDEVNRLQPSGPVDSDCLMDRDAARARESLRRYLDEVGRRALARFKGPPAGLAPDAVLRVQHIFTIR